MTDYTWPDGLAPFGQSFRLQPHVATSESPFTRQMKKYQLSAPRWMTRLAVRGGYSGPDLRGKGAAVDAFLVKLAGGANRALIYDFRRPGPSVTFDIYPFDDDTFFDDGTGFEDDMALGANGAVASGATTMSLTGCAPSTLLFRAGDYVGGDGRAHIILDDVQSNIAGSATINFSPPASAAIAAGAWIYRKVTSPFRLASDDASENASEVGGLEVHDLEFVEDL